jgi:hypothetical protein
VLAILAVGGVRHRERLWVLDDSLSVIGTLSLILRIINWPPRRIEELLLLPRLIIFRYLKLHFPCPRTRVVEVEIEGRAFIKSTTGYLIGILPIR